MPGRMTCLVGAPGFYKLEPALCWHSAARFVVPTSLKACLTRCAGGAEHRSRQPHSSIVELAILCVCIFYETLGELRHSVVKGGLSVTRFGCFYNNSVMNAHVCFAMELLQESHGGDGSKYMSLPQKATPNAYGQCAQNCR